MRDAGQRRARIALQDFRRRQEAALNAGELLRNAPRSIKERPHIPRADAPRILERLVVRLDLRGAPPPPQSHFFVHRLIELYGQFVVSLCQRGREPYRVELPADGPDPFWFLPQTNDWYAGASASIPIANVIRCRWQGMVVTRELIAQLDRLLPRRDHEQD